MVKMFAKLLLWLESPRHSFYRRTDVRVLWPLLCKHGPTREQAKQTMLIHMRADPSWTEHYTDQELQTYVDMLDVLRTF